MLAALGATLLLAVPQGPDRAVLAVRVLDTSGKPWSDATVRAHSCPLPERPHLGGSEQLESRTDGDGRVALSLRRDRPYTLWALQADGDRYRRRVVIEALAPWRDGAPFRYRVLSRTTHRVVVDGALDAEHGLVLPELPGEVADVVVQDAGGGSSASSSACGGTMRSR